MENEYIPPAFTPLCKLGEGSFGDCLLVAVTNARDAHTLRLALKRVRLRGAKLHLSVLRELLALRALSGERHVVKFYDAWAHGSALCILQQYCQHDLYKVIKAYADSETVMPMRCVYRVAYEMFTGLQHIHAQGIMHRDIKPGNLLFADGVLKIADFGLACLHEQDNEEHSHQVATRWYRAPELLFGCRNYDERVDTWAAGAVLAELYSGTPIFAGCSDIDQIYKVFQVRGSPAAGYWHDAAEMPDYDKILFPSMEKMPLVELLPRADDLALDLLDHLLMLSAKNRYTAQQALEHPYFSSNNALSMASNQELFEEFSRLMTLDDAVKTKKKREEQEERPMIDADDLNCGLTPWYTHASGEQCNPFADGISR